MSLVTINDEYLSAIGTSIRNKNGTTDLIKPKDMAAAIDAITGGGGVDLDIPVITGNCKYRFINNGWNWVINQLGNQLKTNNIINSDGMFDGCNDVSLTNIPFEINYDKNYPISLRYMFRDCRYLTSFFKFNNCKPTTTESMFENCHRLRYLPEGIETWFDWSAIESSTDVGYGDRRRMFKNCFSLRSVPMEFLKHENPYIYPSYSMYYELFYECDALDEVVGLPINTGTQAKTSNMFVDTFTNCGRLKNMTFETNEDGSPIVVKWKNQTIDLSQYVGWIHNLPHLLDYNSGIDDTFKVASSNIWEMYKDAPDWWTMEKYYSRYNLDSAVATINSLPDASEYLATAGGTNTIKFESEAGANEPYEDANGKQAFKKISNLTEEQIAVAAAKGWTVSLV